MPRVFHQISIIRCYSCEGAWHVLVRSSWRIDQIMRKLAVSAVIIGVFAFYSLMHGRANPASPSAVLPRPTTGSSGTPTATDAGAATSPTATSGSVYKNGTYVGNVADAQWGYVHVKGGIQGGKIPNVQSVRYA